MTSPMFSFQVPFRQQGSETEQNPGQPQSGSLYRSEVRDVNRQTTGAGCGYIILQLKKTGINSCELGISQLWFHLCNIVNLVLISCCSPPKALEKRVLAIHQQYNRKYLNEVYGTYQLVLFGGNCLMLRSLTQFPLEIPRNLPCSVKRQETIQYIRTLPNIYERNSSW